MIKAFKEFIIMILYNQKNSEKEKHEINEDYYSVNTNIDFLNNTLVIFEVLLKVEGDPDTSFLQGDTFYN